MGKKRKTEEEKMWEYIRKEQERMPVIKPPTPQLMQPILGETREYKLGRHGQGYVCKHPECKCGQYFDTLQKAAAHVHHVKAERRKHLQLDVPDISLPKTIPGKYELLKVTRIGKSTRIISTLFIPPDWVKIIAAIINKGEGEVIVWFRRLEGL